MFDSVLTRSISAQPPTPAIGDRYLIPPAATGTDWSGKNGRLGVYLESGWKFPIYPIGRLLFIEDAGAYYHRDATGAWIAGVGSIAIIANSIAITAIIGAKASALIKVENQTTNTPPASPVVPTAYIIGSSPTGSWASQTGKLAICLVAGAFTIINPDEGDEVYDKSLKINIKFNGSAWGSASGVWVGRAPSIITASGTTATVGGGSYTYSSGTPPTTTHRCLVDQASIGYVAKRSGAPLRFDYTADVTWGAGGSTGIGGQPSAPVVVGLYRDAVVNALSWKIVPLVSEVMDLVKGSGAGYGTPMAFSSVGTVRDFFEVAAPDTAAHAYYIRVHSGISQQNLTYIDVSTITRRTLSLVEAA